MSRRKRPRHAAAPQRAKGTPDAASQSPCPSAEAVEALRSAAEPDEAAARGLLQHLGHQGCPDCWQTIRRLSPLAVETEDGMPPPLPAGLEPSDHPVVLALRTLGGWPPPDWLWPDHALALETADGPGGFLALALEEAHRVIPKAKERAPLLEHWLEVIFGKAEGELPSNPPDTGSSEVRYRAFAYMADAYRADGNESQALLMIHLLDQVFEGQPASVPMTALLTRLRLRLLRPQHHPVVVTIKEGVDQLVAEGWRERAIHLCLAVNDYEMLHGDVDSGQPILERAFDLLEDLRAPSLISLRLRYGIWHRLLRAADQAPPTGARLVFHGTCVGRLCSLPKVPRELDVRTSAFAHEVDSLCLDVPPRYGIQSLEDELMRLGSGPGTAVYEAHLRVWLAARQRVRKSVTRVADNLHRIRTLCRDHPEVEPSLHEGAEELDDLYRQGFGPIEGMMVPILTMLHEVCGTCPAHREG